MAGKPSLIDQLSVRLSAAIFAALVMLSGLWMASEYADFRATSEQIRADGEARLKNELHQIVTDAATMIEYERRRTEDRVERILRERVDEAHAIAMRQIALFGSKMSRPDLEALVRESLRPIRFNDGRGYYFAFNTDGVEQLFAARPELEGKNMLGLTGARGEFVVRDMLDIVRAHGNGFTRYYWTQPGKPGNDHLKISYVRALEPLGWVLGTGEYVGDMEESIQAEVASRLSAVRFGEDGYLFVTRGDGHSVVGPHAGRNPFVEGNKNAADLMRRFQDMAKAGGGIVTYDMPTGYGLRPASKAAYVLDVPDWDWTIGATTYVEGDNALLAAQAVALRQGVMVKLAIGLAVATMLGGVMVVVIRTVSRRAARDSQSLEGALTVASEQLTDIDLGGLSFAEHQRFAEAANRLIAKRRDAEQALSERSHELERINDELERFAYVTSHDLQEPLRTVQLFLQMLERHLGDDLDQDARDYIGFAVQGAQRMRANILSLLNYSRSGGALLTLESVDLGELIASVQASLKSAIDSSGAEIVSGPMPTIVCDSVQIGAVFLNLVSNALRYRHPDRALRIRIDARKEGEFWLFSVADNGIGIPAEYHQAVFEIFRRFNKPGQESGTGIGLALCRRVVEGHGGHIWLQSDGDGATFFFTLPDVPPATSP
ncbi:MAG: cache domain-containing protein [Alphaproteobacteria bacterium]|nr:cache domain-containing protein [Alphaproteobacteria bacterium]